MRPIGSLTTQGLTTQWNAGTQFHGTLDMGNQSITNVPQIWSYPNGPLKLFGWQNVEVNSWNGQGSFRWWGGTGTPLITMDPSGSLTVAGPITANGNYGIIFPGTDNWDSLHWNVASGQLRIGPAGGVLRVEGNTNFLGTIAVNGATAIDASGVALSAHQAYYA